MSKPQPRKPAEPSWLEAAGKAHVRAALAAIRQSKVFDLVPDLFSNAALQEMLRRVCPPSALMRQIGWVEEGRISGSS